MDHGELEAANPSLPSGLGRRSQTARRRNQSGTCVGRARADQRGSGPLSPSPGNRSPEPSGSRRPRSAARRRCRTAEALNRSRASSLRVPDDASGGADRAEPVGAGGVQCQPRRLSDDSDGAGLHGLGRGLRHRGRIGQTGWHRAAPVDVAAAQRDLRRGGVILYEDTPLVPAQLKR